MEAGSEKSDDSKVGVPMRSREMFVGERESIDSIEWPDSGFDIDDQSFAEAIAVGRDERHAA